MHPMYSADPAQDHTRVKTRKRDCPAGRAGWDALTRGVCPGPSVVSGRGPQPDSHVGWGALVHTCGPFLLKAPSASVGKHDSSCPRCLWKQVALHTVSLWSLKITYFKKHFAPGLDRRMKTHHSERIHKLDIQFLSVHTTNL